MFVISKIIGFLISPLTIVLALFSLSVLARGIGLRRLGAASGWLALVFATAIGGTPLPEIALRALERMQAAK